MPRLWGRSQFLAFMISAYLFYRNFQFSKTVSKWKSRCKSLPSCWCSAPCAACPCRGARRTRPPHPSSSASSCGLLPYVLWNILYYLGYVVVTRLSFVENIIGKEPVAFNLKELLLAAVYYKYNPVFWYLFQLLLLVLLAPFLYMIIRRKRSGLVWLLLLIFALWKNVSIPLLNLDAIFSWLILWLLGKIWGIFALYTGPYCADTFSGSACFIQHFKRNTI